MTTAFIILALACPLMVGGAFFVGVIAGHRLSKGLSPAGAPAEAVQAVKESVQVFQPGTAAVPSEVDEYEAEVKRRNDEIKKALAGYQEG